MIIKEERLERAAVEMTDFAAGIARVFIRDRVFLIWFVKVDRRMAEGWVREEEREKSERGM